MPYVTQFCVDGLEDHGLNAVLAVEFASMNTDLVNDYAGSLFKIVLPVDPVASFKKFIKVVGLVFRKLNVNAVACAKTEICAIHCIHIAAESNAAWSLPVQKRIS